MSLNLSTVLLGAALLLGVGVAVGAAPIKPWLFVAGGALVVGFLVQPSSSGT